MNPASYAPTFVLSIYSIQNVETHEAFSIFSRHSVRHAYFAGVLLSKVQNPDTRLFRRTLNTLILREEVASSHEVLISYPELQEIKMELGISYLKLQINEITGGPAPIVSEASAFQLQEYEREIKQLRKRVNKDLSKFITAQEIDIPINRGIHEKVQVSHLVRK